MDIRGRQQRDADVVMLVVVPVEEGARASASNAEALAMPRQPTSAFLVGRWLTSAPIDELMSSSDHT
jgi:hypothetical protein